MDKQAPDQARRGATSVNPATDQELEFYEWIDDETLEHILHRAHKAFEAWRGSGLDERADLLQRVAKALRDEISTLAFGITLEMGKPLLQARQEIEKCAGLCEWYSENLEKLMADEPVDVGGDGHAVISLQPLGCVFGVMPWNFPFWQVLRAAVPIIASGNAFVLKHADNVQGSALALLQTMQRANVPHGLFSVVNVHRSRVSEILADSRIVGVSATAGVRAGAAIASAAARNLKLSLLELGGSDPFIVLKDADIEAAAEAAVQARFQNTGQVCIAAKRIILESDIADDFTGKFLERSRKLVVGDPLESGTDLGPMARRRLLEELHLQVEESVSQGADILCGGVPLDGPGAFYPPTILSAITRDMPVFRQETFGPVAAITVVKSADEAVATANDSEFGLSASLWSSDANRAERCSQQINAGSVFVNGISVSDPRIPIGGIKNSGYGRELSYFGLRAFSNVQMRWIR